jgi:hypothetical protein
MSRYDKYITLVKEAYVTCSGCGKEESWESQDPACSGGDLQDPKEALKGTLREDGWVVRKNKLLCPECKEGKR